LLNKKMYIQRLDNSVLLLPMELLY